MQLRHEQKTMRKGRNRNKTNTISFLELAVIIVLKVIIMYFCLEMGKIIQVIYLIYTK